jgi:hypothetical protein
MALGTGLMTSLGSYDSTMKYLVFVFLANFGQGITSPAMLSPTLGPFGRSGQSSCSAFDRTDPTKVKLCWHALCTSSVCWVAVEV